jgi:hypothetical protein
VLERPLRDHVGEAERGGVPGHEREREDLWDVEGRLPGERALEARQRPEVVRVVAANDRAHGAVAHVVGREGEVPRAEALVQIAEHVGGSLG